MIALGVDAGGSSTRWQLRSDDGNELGRGTAGPITGHVFTAADLAATSSRLAELLAEVKRIARPHSVVAGITGYHPGSPASAELARTICDYLELPRERVLLVDDMHIAYASVFEPGAGVLVYGGTGSVACHVTAEGRLLRAGGHGYLIDDAGAGYWIGRQGLRQTLRWADETPGERSPLAREIYAALGCDTWDRIVVEVYGAGRQRVAALAPAVARAADRGDESAAAILRQAGAELARLAAVLSGRLDASLPVALAGGISRLSPLLTGSLRDALPAGTPFQVVSVEPITAAVRLALARGGGGSSGE